jgi:uncharacterized protein YcaQ
MGNPPGPFRADSHKIVTAKEAGVAKKGKFRDRFRLKSAPAPLHADQQHQQQNVGESRMGHFTDAANRAVVPDYANGQHLTAPPGARPSSPFDPRFTEQARNEYFHGRGTG